MPDLNAVVQRMIDAGESEENIATVIGHQKRINTPAHEVAKTEPDTYAAGYWAQLKKELTPPTLAEFQGNLGQALEPMAHPQTATDFGNLLIPNMGGMNARRALTLGRQTVAKVPAAVQAARRPLGGALNAIGEIGKEIDVTKPLAQPAKLTGFIGGKLRSPNAPPSGIETYSPNVGGAPTVRGGVTPSISEEILNRKAAIRDAQSRQAMGEHPGAYGEGGLMPSGMEPTELRIGQPTDAELRASAARPRTAAPEGDMRPQDQIIEEIRNRTKQSPELRKTLDENLQRQSDTRHSELGNQPPRQMGAARPISLKSEAMSPAQWKENLAYYGADKLSQLTGLPRAEVIQRAGSMAGHLPLEAETQMMDLGGPR